MMPLLSSVAINKLAKMVECLAFLFVSLFFLCHIAKSSDEKGASDYHDYTIDTIPRNQDIARKVIITTDWKGYMPVCGSNHTHEITVEPISMTQSDILSIEIICSQQRNKNYVNGYKQFFPGTPSWNIITDLNNQSNSYLCDLLLAEPHCEAYSVTSHASGRSEPVYYGTLFHFRSVGKTGRFELEYTVTGLATCASNCWHPHVDSTGTLIVHIPVDIVPEQGGSTVASRE